MWKRLVIVCVLAVSSACGEGVEGSGSALEEGDADAGRDVSPSARQIGGGTVGGGGLGTCATPACGGDRSCMDHCREAEALCNGRNANLGRDDLMEPCGLYFAQCSARCERRPW